MLRRGPRRLDRRRALAMMLVGLVAAVFVVQGAAKLVGASHERVAFTERWGYPLWFMYGVGAAEVACAALLVWPRTRLLGALGVVAVMLGAIATLVRVGETQGLPLPLTLLGFGAMIAATEWQHRMALRGRPANSGTGKT